MAMSISTLRQKSIISVCLSMFVGIAALLCRARFVTTQKHSALLAVATLGPVTSLRAVGLLFVRVFRKMGIAMKGLKNLSDHIAEYKPQCTDIIVAVPGKSGTTWVMQIAHQLRMRGVEHDYDDQMDVMPWLEGGPAAVLHQDINMEQPAAPRVFKSHLEWPKLSVAPFEKSKLVYCFRDVKDQLISFWKFIPPIVHSEISCWAFTTGMVVSGMVDKGLNNLCDFWEHRDDERVCFLFFDDLKEYHEESVVRVQRFMGLGNDENLTKRVVSQSTHEYMSRPDQSKKFDDHKIVFAMDKRRGITRTMPLTGKVRKDGGKIGSGDALPQAVKDWVDWRWKCIVLPRTGFVDLASMRRAWRAERQTDEQQ